MCLNLFLENRREIDIALDPGPGPEPRTGIPFWFQL